MSKLICLISLLMLSGLAFLAMSAEAVGISFRTVHYSQPVRTLSVDYDWRIQKHIACDGSSKGAFDYDGAAVRTPRGHPDLCNDGI